MNRDDIEKLLGGYATGTLTASERAALFETALTDQTLFNALANEQALKDLLDNPQARRRLLTALRAQASRPSWLSRLREWCGPLVAVRAMAGGATVAILAVVTVTRLLDITPPPVEVTENLYDVESSREHAKSADTLRAKKQSSAAPKRSEARDQAAAPQIASREADMKQNLEAERQAANVPQPETKRVEPAAAAPAAKAEAPAPQPLAKTAPAAPAADLLARSNVGRADTGARALFYETRQKEKAAVLEQRSAESGSAVGGALQERPAEAPVQRLGLRYGIVPREEGPALVIEVNQRGYLYASARDAAGARIELYPPFAGDAETALVEPGTRYFIPPLGAFPATKLTLILSRTPLADPTTTAASKPSDKKDAFLLQRTMESLEGINGPTLYVVETAPSLSSSLSINIVVPAR